MTDIIEPQLLQNLTPALLGAHFLVLTFNLTLLTNHKMEYSRLGFGMHTQHIGTVGCFAG